MTDGVADQASQGIADEQTYLNKLVGEGNKYVDTENLAKAYMNLEQHTETIKQEKLELENKLNIQQEKDTHLETIVGLLK